MNIVDLIGLCLSNGVQMYNCGYQVHSAVIPYFVMIFMIHNIILTCFIISNISILTTILGMYNGGTDFLFGLPLYLISRILVALTLV